MAEELYDIIRIAGCPADRANPQDVLSQAAPFGWLGNDWQFQLGWFEDKFRSQWIADISTLAEIIVELRPWTAGSPAPDADLIPAAVSGNTNSFTAVTGFPLNWNNGSGQLGTVTIPRSATARGILSGGSYWLTIYALSNETPAKKKTLCAGLFLVQDDGTSAFPTDPNFVAMQNNLPNITQIPSNGTTGLGDLNTAPYLNGPDYGVLCPDAATGSGVLVKQFWYVRATALPDAAGFVQSGPDSGATGAKWLRG